MTIDTKDRKFKLIELVISTNNDEALEKAEKILTEATLKPDIQQAVKPIRSNVSLDDIKKEQNYQAISYKEFKGIAEELDWEESVEELLAMLSK